VVLIFSNLIYLADPQEEAYITIMRSWLLFPMMIVPLVLIAWQYRLRYVIIFILFSTAVEYFVLLPKVIQVDFETVPILGVPLIRAFAFGTVGQIVTQLIATQRLQRKELMRANIQLGQHTETLEQLAISRERNRLARELHDTLAHTLSGLAVNLEAIKFVPGGERQEIRQMLDNALQYTRNGLTETRRALKDLRAKQLEELGLNIATRNLAADAASRAGFQLDMDIDDNLVEMTPDVEQCVYRIAQEALENIVKHAEAQKVIVHLSYDEEFLRLIVYDDGIGFDVPAITFEDKHGLKGMRERAAEAGASLDITSRPEEGTRLQLSLEYLWSKS
jgi:signal transduction histidine kinase